LDFKILSKFNQFHQAPIKSISLIQNNFIENNIYVIAGSYDQVISIIKVSGNSKVYSESELESYSESSSIENIFDIKKRFINLAELNGLCSYLDYIIDDNEISGNNENDNFDYNHQDIHESKIKNKKILIYCCGQGLEFFEYKL
jgi:hypothetical protein